MANTPITEEDLKTAGWVSQAGERGERRWTKASLPGVWVDDDGSGNLWVDSEHGQAAATIGQLEGLAMLLSDISQSYAEGGPRVSRATAALNEAFARDPQAMHALLTNRIPCNRALADDPFVVVEVNRVLDDAQTVGALGLVNGVLSATGQPLVAAKYSDTGAGPIRLSGFVDYVPMRT